MESNNENNKKVVKDLYSIVKSGEFQTLHDVAKDYKKRAEELFRTQRAILRKIEEELKESAQKATAAEKPAPAPAPAPAPVTTAAEKPAPAPVQAEEVDKSTTEKDEAQNVAPTPTPVQTPPESTAKEAEKEAPATRSGIPSYIRGMVKRPPPTPQPSRDKTQRPTTARPQTARPVRPSVRPERPAVFPRVDNAFAAKKPREATKKEYDKPDDKRTMNKRTLIRKGYINEDLSEERMGARKIKPKKATKAVAPVIKKLDHAVVTTENMTVKMLSEAIGKTVPEIIKQLLILDYPANINTVVPFDQMELVASEFGVALELKLDKTSEEKMEDFHSEPDDESKLKERPPIITVMGHVDHGKTSLLDVIRKTSVASGEAGGITQQIGAYSVDVNGKHITFLDTPGHEAFSEMRARGARVTDIAILIVAADDGIMPQTVEAIKHAKDAEVPIIVAVNKIDKPDANLDKVREQLADHELLCEEWGGQTMVVPISAKKNIGIDKLLEGILLTAECCELRANPDREARGTIIEAKLDRGKGPVANIVVKNGTLHVGDYIVSGNSWGRVRAMTDDKGRAVKSAPPSTPVSVQGFADVPMAGDNMFVVANEKMAKQVVEERNAKQKQGLMSAQQAVTIDDLYSKMSDVKLKQLNIVLKADVQGTLEALSKQLIKMSNEEVRVNIVSGGVGPINQSDFMMANVSKSAVIIGFNVRADSETRTLAERAGIKIYFFNVIYDATNMVDDLIKSMLDPVYEEKIMGQAEVKSAFSVSGIGLIAGSLVVSGKIVTDGSARVMRNGKVVYDGKIVSLKHYKDDVKEVSAGTECGICVEGYKDPMEKDVIECYRMEVKPVK